MIDNAARTGTGQEKDFGSTQQLPQVIPGSKSDQCGGNSTAFFWELFLQNFVLILRNLKT